ncbi:hypothetical protein PV08_00396 [Exophiala spinifera]|uniref:Amidohydrolase-related domain-containing protein n=1 Tax=Exophiala spinifera TaxID=91928 RepID=A0A0D1YWY1_9EURO|nr:uncharacterized protein PV08_00396 [Exophiala spinifera]KIW19821.1 hypothetical protein PV08_00396 [Exophiala spinifera]
MSRREDRYNEDATVGLEFVPAGSWDCHMHCFNPVRFPLSPDRAYTPIPASLSDYEAWSPFDNINIVQATIEASPEGVLAHIAEGSRTYSGKQFCGTIISDSRSAKTIANATTTQIDRLHDAGVRCLRLHCGFGGSKGLDQFVVHDLGQLAKSTGVVKHGWAISLQMPLCFWASLRDKVAQDDSLKRVKLIADHVGYVGPSDLATAGFEAFLNLIRSDNVYVKISALHRRSPNKIEDMKDVIQQLANAAPDRMLWGSDWPHVNSGAKGLEPTPPLSDADALEELKMVKRWLTSEQWTKMLVDNPCRVFRGRDDNGSGANI